MSKTAILIDGAFFKFKYKQLTGHFSTADDVITYCQKLMQEPQLSNSELFRIYYYDCYPFLGRARNPLNGITTDYSTTLVAQKSTAFLKALRLKANVAFREGSLSYDGWTIPTQNISQIVRNSGVLQPDDLKISLTQKRVDIKIGLDIAWLASKRIVEKVVLVTGDSDFVPAMKFARTEGINVYLCCFGHGVKEDLKVHADDVINTVP